MELRELKYFLAVTREQSISKAADALFVTQPNLSRQMQNLEKEIGKQLFIRGTKKSRLRKRDNCFASVRKKLLNCIIKRKRNFLRPLLT